MAKKKPLSRHERATLEALLVWKLAKETLRLFGHCAECIAGPIDCIDMQSSGEEPDRGVELARIALFLLDENTLLREIARVKPEDVLDAIDINTALTEENERFRELAKKIADANKAIKEGEDWKVTGSFCNYCKEAWTNLDGLTREQAAAAAREHDKVCPENPMLKQLVERQSKINNLEADLYIATSERDEAHRAVAREVIKGDDLQAELDTMTTERDELRAEIDRLPSAPTWAWVEDLTKQRDELYAKLAELSCAPPWAWVLQLFAAHADACEIADRMLNRRDLIRGTESAELDRARDEGLPDSVAELKDLVRLTTEALKLREWPEHMADLFDDVAGTAAARLEKLGAGC